MKNTDTQYLGTPRSDNVGIELLKTMNSNIRSSGRQKWRLIAITKICLRQTKQRIIIKPIFDGITIFSQTVHIT